MRMYCWSHLVVLAALLQKVTPRVLEDMPTELSS